MFWCSPGYYCQKAHGVSCLHVHCCAGLHAVIVGVHN
jgi:hypothetical protein